MLRFLFWLKIQRKIAVSSLFVEAYFWALLWKVISLVTFRYVPTRRVFDLSDCVQSDLCNF